MRFIDFFAGIGGFRRGMELAGHNCVGFCEFDKFATASYTSMHLLTPDQREYLKKMPLKQRQKEILKEEYRNGEWYANDIRRVYAEDIPKADYWCFGAPCFIKGTLITTHRGLVPIEEIQIGDYVLTHTNRFQKVIKPMINVKKGIYTLQVKGSPQTEVTGNHRFYVRDKTRVWNSELKKYEVKISEPYWKAVEDFDGNELIQFTVNHNNVNVYDLTEDECWLLGRYVADGYIINNKRKDRLSNNTRVVFCVGTGKERQFENKAASYNMYISNGINVKKYTTGNKRLFTLCSMCGRGAENKIIPQFIINLNPKLLKYFIEGYLSGDGSCVNGLWKATSTSKKLIYQLGQCVSKAYETGYSIYYCKRPEQCQIEGRTVNQNDTWSITFRLNVDSSQSYYIDKCLWQPIRKIEYKPTRIEIVYNMEVENDNSYTANNMGVHNCQDFSVAGKRAGLNGDRSSLIREIFRLLEEQKEQDRPKWLIYENVKGMFSSNKGLDYLSILSELDRLGYDAEWQIINSKWWVPQNRERVYTIGHLRGRGFSKIFPIEGADGENSVSIIGHRDGYRRNTQTFSPDGITEALDTGQGGGRGHHVGIPCFVDLSYKKSKLTDTARCLQARYNKGIANHEAEVSGVAIPILTPDRAEKRQNGRRFKEDGEPMFTLTGQDRHGVGITVEVIQAECSKSETGIYVKFPNGTVCYAVWFEKYQCYIAIRKLTPKECFRLQGWTDDYFEKAAFVNSDSQLYKQAGNGVTVNVIYEIAKRLKECEND